MVQPQHLLQESSISNQQSVFSAQAIGVPSMHPSHTREPRGPAFHKSMSLDLEQLSHQGSMPAAVAKVDDNPAGILDSKKASSHFIGPIEASA